MATAVHNLAEGRILETLELKSIDLTAASLGRTPPAFQIQYVAEENG